MMKTKKLTQRLTGALVAGAALLASSATAQMPEPFAAMPADTEVFARLDFQALSNAPGFGDVASYYKTSDANFQNLPFYANSGLQKVMLAANGVEAVIYEMGMIVDESEPRGYLISYGKFNPAAIFQAATQAGFTAGPEVGGLSTLADPGGEFLFTMLNDWTFAMSESPEGLQKIMAANKGEASPLSDSAEVTSLLAKTSGAMLSVGMRNEGGVRAAMEELSSSPPQQAMMIPGALPVLKDLPNLTAGGGAFSANGYYFEMDYASAEAAQKGAQNMTLLVKGAAALAEQQMGAQLQADPNTASQIQAMKNISLSADGTTVSHTIPMSPEEMQQMAQGIQMSMPMFIQMFQNAQREAEAQSGGTQQMSGPQGQLIPPAQREEFPNFQTADISNKYVDLEEYEGKVVLVDYWATWCGPCRQTKPFIKDMYARRHDDGLEIIGVSLDESISDLRSYVTRNDMPWRQVSDLRGWSSKYAQQMGVNSIPHVFVLDKEGRIAARGGLRGEQLETIIAQVMSE